MSATEGLWPPGYALNPSPPRPDPQLIAAFRTVAVAHAGDVMGRNVGTMGLRAYHGNEPATMCGPAFTVLTRPGDNLMVHLAVGLAEPGDVIVVDGGGSLSAALVGGLIRTTAIARGLGGMVIDGAVRDVSEWAEGGFPIHALGHTHRGPGKDGPGKTNVPITCAGLAVAPGDLVLGDADGVIAIPAGDLAGVLAACRALAAREDQQRAKNASGTFDRSRFDEILRAKGCPV
jgi:RraA family protein